MIIMSMLAAFVVCFVLHDLLSSQRMSLWEFLKKTLVVRCILRTGEVVLVLGVAVILFIMVGFDRFRSRPE